MSNFSQIYDFINLINDPACYKKPENPTCIDLIMSNKPKCSKNSITAETELLDFHK